MRFSLKIVSVGGIPIELHITFILFIGLFFYLSYIVSDYYPLFLLVFLFVAVTIHELAHSAVARHYKVKVTRIVLYPIGGVSEIEDIPENPHIEWRLAISGPAVSFLITGILYFLWRYLSVELPANIFNAAGVLTGDAMLDLIYLNGLMAAFNLLPAFPMDGGRVLRALLAERMNFSRATSIAATVGRTFGLLLTVYGIFYDFFIAFIGLFIYFGANQEAASAVVSTTLAGVKVDDVMTGEVSSATRETTLSDALEIMFKARYHDILIRDDGTFEGVVKWSDIMKVNPKQRPVLKLGQMRIQQISAFRDEPVLEVYRRMIKEKVDLIPVVDKESPKKVVGVITSEGVARAYERAREIS
jgi:Zn-dependent protease/predicted transcriptional regulator